MEAHIDGSHDAAHQEERGEEHREQIEANAEEVEELPEEEPSAVDGGPFGPSEPTVDVSGGGSKSEEVPITTAVEVNREMLANPEDFGIASGEETRATADVVERLRDEVEDLDGAATEREKQIRELYQVVAELAETRMFGGEPEWRHRP